ncbi:BLUF domain-containing protein [Leptothrix ochracea]|uniref:BLUF domain-containing protein n=1 Tax=Leptothrix ochracea TaxID=735331 RepID=UPI0034E2B14C
MLVRLLYVSRCSSNITPDLVEAVLKSARKTNPPLGLTGLLCHSDNVFLQVLEGDRDQVNFLYNKIAKDPRHKDLCLLHYEPIMERRFSGWAMGQVSLSQTHAALLLKYGAKPQLDPYAISGRASLAMLEELISSAQAGGRS